MPPASYPSACCIFPGKCSKLIKSIIVLLTFKLIFHTAKLFSFRIPPGFETGLITISTLEFLIKANILSEREISILCMRLPHSFLFFLESEKKINNYCKIKSERAISILCMRLPDVGWNRFHI